ncbi:diguanylate cyclase [Blastococcus sp. BMG 814]|uniref:Diguanylate cyclase n=1 Tax=Blastococcus carthaginiensis TaxID=3050034 RepID=A0ABT9IBW8_9ACTN|nr:diguanylate cyclase [Blastococcus carthaginiensis]MDP5183066.1 diguanylate cyclase [Blastococcus carthaginiensis]
MAPRTHRATPAAPVRPATPAATAPVTMGAELLGDATLVRRALAATPSGVCLVDVRLPDQPLVYVNPAFERLAGMPGEELLGRNCRFLQGPDTDPGALARIRAAIAAGQECREVLVNHRGPDRTPWYNELHLAPVTDATGAVVQYIGVQVDVTGQVRAQRALEQERDRTRGYLARIEELSVTDPLTGLSTRRHVEEQTETALWNARCAGDAVALVVVAVDGFTSIEERYGSTAAEQLLAATGQRLRARLRRGDLVARWARDSFVVVLPGLAAGSAGREAARVRAGLAEAARGPVLLAGAPVVTGISTGAACFPADGDDVTGLLAVAERAAGRLPVSPS